MFDGMELYGTVGQTLMSDYIDPTYAELARSAVFNPSTTTALKIKKSIQTNSKSDDVDTKKTLFVVQQTKSKGQVPLGMYFNTQPQIDS